MVTRQELIKLVNKLEQSYFMKNIQESDTEKFKEELRGMDIFKSEVRTTEAYVEQDITGEKRVIGEIRTALQLMDNHELEVHVVETTEPRSRSHIEIYMDEHVTEDRLEDMHYYIQEIQSIEERMK